MLIKIDMSEYILEMKFKFEFIKSENDGKKFINENKSVCFRKIQVLRKALTFPIQLKILISMEKAIFLSSKDGRRMPLKPMSNRKIESHKLSRETNYISRSK